MQIATKYKNKHQLKSGVWFYWSEFGRGSVPTVHVRVYDTGLGVSENVKTKVFPTLEEVYSPFKLP